MEAITAFKADAVLRVELGEVFHNYFVMLKEFEVNRFLASVTDWEQTEYFEMYRDAGRPGFRNDGEA